MNPAAVANPCMIDRPAFGQDGLDDARRRFGEQRAHEWQQRLVQAPGALVVARAYGGGHDGHRAGDDVPGRDHTARRAELQDRVEVRVVAAQDAPAAPGGRGCSAGTPRSCQRDQSGGALVEDVVRQPLQ